MVFFLPGILCRRAFFIGKFKKHFDAGNSLERVLWNLLISFVMLIAFCLTIYAYNVFATEKFEFDLKSTQVLDTFICIYQNELPSIFYSESQIISVVKVLLSIYAYSIIIGFLTNRAIFYLGLEKRYSIFKFQNNWDYLTNSNKLNNLSHSIGDIYYTKVDIKTGKNELFTGKLHDISLDKEGKIEAVTLQEAYKFYKLEVKEDSDKIDEVKGLIDENDPYIIEHSESKNEFIYRKRIKGDLFTVLNNDIQNIAITYIKISNFYEKFQKFLNVLLSFLILLIVLFSISYAIWDFHIFSFANYNRRLAFCITTPFVFGLFALLFFNIFDFDRYKNDNKKYFNEIIDNLLILILFAFPYLYVFNIFSSRTTVIIFFIYFMLCGFIFSLRKNKK